MFPYILAALITVAIVIVISNIHFVQQSRSYVIERLGGFHTVWGVGPHFKVPFIDRIARRVSLKEQVLDYPPQPVITKDNVTMQIDTVVYFQITAVVLWVIAAITAIFPVWYWKKNIAWKKDKDEKTKFLVQNKKELSDFAEKICYFTIKC